MPGGAFEDLAFEPALTRGRSSSDAGPSPVSDFSRTTPDRHDSQAGLAAPYAGDGGLLDSFDQEFAQGELPMQGHAEHYESDSVKAKYPPIATLGGRETEYRKVEADREKARLETPYAHAGGRVPTEFGNDWNRFLWSRMDPENRLSPEERADGREAWEDTRGQMIAPAAGWDKPTVGRFRSAMSWLGNKLTFGKFFGKNYKSRQDDLAKRRGIMSHAFSNQMSYFNEREYDLANPDADDHDYAKQRYGRRYIGTKGDVNLDSNSPYNNPRYNNASSWIKESKYGRAKWDRLAAKQRGKKHVDYGLLTR